MHSLRELGADRAEVFFLRGLTSRHSKGMKAASAGGYPPIFLQECDAKGVLVLILQECNSKGLAKSWQDRKQVAIRGEQVPDLGSAGHKAGTAVARTTLHTPSASGRTSSMVYFTARVKSGRFRRDRYQYYCATSLPGA